MLDPKVVDEVWNEFGGHEKFMKSFGYQQFAEEIAKRVPPYKVDHEAYEKQDLTVEDHGIDQWWVAELERFWGSSGSHCTDDTRRAAKVALNFIHLVLGKNRPGTFQKQVHNWAIQCFGAELANDPVERNQRFLEESVELVQALGCTEEEAHQIVSYVFSRPVGEAEQEVGGVMVTLGVLCEAHNLLNMVGCGLSELTRIWEKMDKIRVKQKAKPRFGADYLLAFTEHSRHNVPGTGLVIAINECPPSNILGKNVMIGDKKYWVRGIQRSGHKTALEVREYLDTGNWVKDAYD